MHRTFEASNLAQTYYQSRVSENNVQDNCFNTPPQPLFDNIDLNLAIELENTLDLDKKIALHIYLKNKYKKLLSSIIQPGLDSIMLGSVIGKVTKDIHNNSNNIIVSPDSNYIIIGGNPNFLWNLKDPEKVIIQQLQKKEEKVKYNLTSNFSEDSTSFLTGSASQIFLWQIEDQAQIKCCIPLPVNHCLNVLSFSPNGQYAAIAYTNQTNEKNYINIQNLSSIDVNLSNSLEVSHPVQNFTFTPNCKDLFIIFNEAILDIFPIRSANRNATNCQISRYSFTQENSKYLSSIYLSANTKYILIPNPLFINFCQIQKDKKFKLKDQLVLSQNIEDAHISNSGNLVAAKTDKDIILWSYKHFNNATIFFNNNLKASAMAVSPNDNYLIIGYVSGDLLIFDIENSKYNIFKAHNDQITKIIISSNNNYAVSTSADNCVCLWKINKSWIIDQLSLSQLMLFIAIAKNSNLDKLIADPAYLNIFNSLSFELKVLITQHLYKRLTQKCLTSITDLNQPVCNLITSYL